MKYIFKGLNELFLATAAILGLGTPLKNKRPPVIPEGRPRGFKSIKEELRGDWNRASPLHRRMNPW